MTQNVTLSDTLKSFVEAEATRKGFGDADRYIASLIAREHEREARREFELSLIEAMNDEATLVTPEVWADIRREVMETIGKGQVDEG